MKNAFYATLVAVTLLLSGFTFINAVDWKIVDGYSVKFTAKDATGVFTKLSGDIVFDENALASSRFDVNVDVASINTGNGMKNKHAKSDKWFDANLYPNIHFTSDKFSKTATGFQVTGILEMHGVKKEVTLPFTFSNNIFAGSFNVNRLDYNIGDTKGMSGKVPAELIVAISVPVTK